MSSRTNITKFFSSIAMGAAALVATTGQSDAQQCPHHEQAVAIENGSAVQLVAFQSGEKKVADIVDTAVGAGNFTTLVAAVKAAGLVDALKGEGPFTVFAPSDAAFGKIPTEKIQELLKPENKAALTDLLTYHVVKGKVTAADVSGIESAEALNGKKLMVTTPDGAVMINKAKVVAADIMCSNGVIHVVDSVIMPPAEGSGSKKMMDKKGSDTKKMMKKDGSGTK